MEALQHMNIGGDEYKREYGVWHCKTTTQWRVTSLKVWVKCNLEDSSFLSWCLANGG